MARKLRGLCDMKTRCPHCERTSLALLHLPLTADIDPLVKSWIQKIHIQTTALVSEDSPSRYRIQRHGTYYRKSDSRRIERFYCYNCKRSFSRATNSARYWQKKRRINEPLKNLLCSGVSQRRACLLLRVNRKTVIRRFSFLATHAKQRQKRWLAGLTPYSLRMLQFDDLESSIHTKCKPISVSLSVEPRSRKILSYSLSSMPAKGLLAQKANIKYGPRPDRRKQGWRSMFRELRRIVHPEACFSSDENPYYPKYLREFFPKATHTRHPGGRGCVAGQGELKKLTFDPLFSLNHTCAMMRANINRLFRRTWCTSKTIEGLRNHIALYVDYHNERLTPRLMRPQSKGPVSERLVFKRRIQFRNDTRASLVFRQRAHSTLHTRGQTPASQSGTENCFESRSSFLVRHPIFASQARSQH